MYFGIAALGSVETLVGILMGDSNSQSFVMGVVVRACVANLCTSCVLSFFLTFLI